MYLFADVSDEWWMRILGPVSGALISGLVALLLWRLNRKRPNIIQVREMEFVSLLRVAETIQSRITTTLDGKCVARLSQIELAIMNASSETIKDISLRFTFPQDTLVLESEISGVTGQKSILNANQLSVTIPYLNACSYHSEILTVKILCDGDASAFEVDGRGEGWSTQRVTIDSIMRFRFGVGFALNIVPLILLFVSSRIMRSSLGVPDNEFSWPLLGAQLVGLAILAATNYATLRWLRAPLKKRGK